MRGKMVIAHREEVLNVVLALLLHRRGVVAAPEQILTKTLEQGRAMPDVLVYYQGCLMGTVLNQRMVHIAQQHTMLKLIL